MKNLSVIAVFAAITMIAFTYSNSLPIGSPLPKGDVKMKEISGKEISVKEATKKNGVLVMFSFNTCPYVVKTSKGPGIFVPMPKKWNLV